jgi:diketogulonate reductase-like aldo/keto reductase
MSDQLRHVALRSGERVPALGQGTWHMGEDRRRADAEAAALRLGIDLGMTLIDTAEMYGSGGAEEVIARAARGLRDQLFIVSKVYPHNASRAGVVAACERSLKRLATDRIDLYLLHWRGSIPLADTLEGFQRLERDGKIRHYGVSNFDRGDMAEWLALEGGGGVAADQVLYNLARRGPEWDLIPWCREYRVAIMAYTPLGTGTMLGDPTLAEISRLRGATPAQVALAWLLRQENMIVIPKASRLEHVRENHGALDLKLADEDLTALDRAFPSPKGRSPLDML